MDQFYILKEHLHFERNKYTMQAYTPHMHILDLDEGDIYKQVKSTTFLSLLKSHQTVNELFHPLTYLSILIFTASLQPNYCLCLITSPCPLHLANCFLSFKIHIKSHLLQDALSDFFRHSLPSLSFHSAFFILLAMVHSYK